VPITLNEAGAALDLPEEAVAGSTISVGWTGPDYTNDYIGIGIAGATGSDRWENFSYTADGNPAALLIPITPGDYLVQYFLGQDRAILTTETITVTALKVEIDAPSEAVAGSTISVAFEGPAYSGDYLGIGRAASDGSDRWENFTYADAGNPLDLLVPIGEGDYLIRYFSGQDRSVLQSVPITVTAVEARLVAPPVAAAGSEIPVGWDGPDYDGDYIGIGRAGADGSDRWDAFAYTEAGNPVTIQLPDAAGDYVIQYFTGQDRVSIASLPLTIE
jgi:Ca-activated chloride channel family protein